MSAPTTVVVAAARGGLPFEQLHGEPLLAHSLRTAAEVCSGPVLVLVDADHDASRLRRLADRARVDIESCEPAAWWAGCRGAALLLDVLCPLLPVAFVSEVAERARRSPGIALVGFRPVTDTVKEVVGGKIMGTIDREGLGIVTSPVVVPVAALGGPPPPLDAAGLVGWLRDRVPVELVRAPSRGRRVEDVASVQLLECVDEIARRTR
jgi:hypothetical protein